MDGKTLFQKLTYFPYELRKEVKLLFDLLDPALHEDTIKYLNFMNYGGCSKLEKAISALKRENSYILFINCYDKESKFLYEICNIEFGEEQNQEGKYPAYGGKFKTSSAFNREGANVLLEKSADSFCSTHFTDEKLFLGKNAFSFQAKLEYVSQKFLLLFIQENPHDILSCMKNFNNLIDEDKYKNIKVKIPDLKKQKEILLIVDKNKHIIHTLKEKIKENEEQLQVFMSESISKLQTKNHVLT